MTIFTITGGGTYDLATSLSLGDGVDFLNTPVTGGTLIVETSALENSTFVTSGLTTTVTGIGGYVTGFQAGDLVTVRDIATDYAIFDHSPDAAAQNATVSADLTDLISAESLLHEDEILTLSGSGLVTDNLGLLEGQSLFGFSLPGSIIADIDTYALEIREAFFGGVPQTASLFITVAADGTSPSVPDAYVTTDGQIAVCYLHGTGILTAEGERPVESLAIGDLVATHSGGLRPVKWIGRQSFDPRFIAGNRDRLPVRIEAGAFAPSKPAAALYVSPGHAMLVGDRLVLAKNLVNGITITQPECTETVVYYAIELATHDCVLANQCWGESFADGPGLRAQFHNAAEFQALYPDHAAPESLALYAPRPEAGPALEVALRPVLARVPARPGLLRGFIDIIEPGRIEGWAWDELNPELPVLLDIFAGETYLGQALACHYRADLAALRLGRGYCKFSFALPAALNGPLAVRGAAGGGEITPTDACRAAA